MSRPNAIREFLTSRRARLTPDQVGIVSHGRRRVPGLRRDEVALLAGISVEYYTQLERGGVTGVSDQVIDAIARALLLDDVEQAHLYDLVDSARRRARRPTTTTDSVGTAAQRVLDAFVDAAAFIRNGRLDILAINPLASALYADAFGSSARVNLARFVFLDEASRRFYRRWDAVADQAVGNLRAEVGRDPDDVALTALVGELVIASDEFAARWARHDVGRYGSGIQLFRHRTVGHLELGYEALDLIAAPGQTLVVYTAAPGSPSAKALRRLRPSLDTDEAAAPNAGGEPGRT